MADNIYPIINEKHFKKFRQLLKNAKAGKGHVVALEGEAGTGKSYLMQEMTKEARKDENIIALMVENEAPIGKFNVSNIQQLKPFSAAMESLIEGDYKSAKERFKKRLGISILASLPITGEIFYAVKEISKDWRYYKKEKSKEKSGDKITAIDEFYDAFNSYANDTPLVLMFDDMQWSDASSVALLQKFTENIDSLPILIVYSYRKSDVSDPSNPLYSYILGKKENHSTIKLEGFSVEEVKKYFEKNLKNYQENEDFISWVMDKSFGNPGIVHEFFRYFQKHPPFNKSGELKIDLNDVSMPVTASAALAENIKGLSNEQRDLLSICSAEGREFTAYMAAKLLNTDVLTVIKKLRNLMSETDIIRSIGANIRYGVKTTIYQFTQAFYYEYFVEGLEYEENLALHGQITKELQQLYETASEDEKEQIAPYLAAHSKESENEELADEMMRYNAEISAKYADEDVLGNTFAGLADEKTEEITKEEEGELSGSVMVGSLTGDDKEDFSIARNEVLEDIFARKFEHAISKAENIFETNSSKLKLLDRVQLLTMIARSYTELNEYETARNKLSEAGELIKEKNNPQAECFILNTQALLSAEKGRTTEAIKYLRRAASMSVVLPNELKLLTITNIAKLYEEKDPDKSKSYFMAAEKLASEMNFDDFKQILAGG